MNLKALPKIWIHLLAICLLLSLPFIFSPQSSWLETLSKNPMAKKDLVIYLLSIGFFYLHYLWLLPKYYYQKKRLAYFIIVLFALLAILLLPELMHYHPNGVGHHRPPHLHNEIGRKHGPPWIFKLRTGMAMFSLAWALSFLLSLTKRLEASEKMKQKAELANLKSQVNPHFLFNSLNTIYALAISQSEQAGDAVLKLSGIMRFVLMESEKETVSLSKEVEYLQDYIALQKLRLGEEFKVQFSIQIEDENTQIAPLLFIPLVENAFKHGVSQEDIHPIEVKLTVQNKQLSFTTSNKKVNKTFINDYPGGLGLENLRQRLMHLYPNNFSLDVTENNEFYHVNLNIHLS
jgi:two-component sensor histidine kinase